MKLTCMQSWVLPEPHSPTSSTWCSSRTPPLSRISSMLHQQKMHSGPEALLHPHQISGSTVQQYECHEGDIASDLELCRLGLKSGRGPSAAGRQKPCPLKLFQQLSTRLDSGCNALLNISGESIYSLFQEQQHHHGIQGSHDCR